MGGGGKGVRERVYTASYMLQITHPMDEIRQKNAGKTFFRKTFSATTQRNLCAFPPSAKRGKEEKMKAQKSRQKKFA